MADYPQAGLQNVDFSGGLGGFFASQQQMDSERERGLAMQGKDLANTYQGLQNDRYGQMTPFELQQKQGEAATAAAKGEIDQGTKTQVMAQKIAEAVKGKSEAELAQLLSESEKQVQKLTGAKAKYLQAEKMGQGPQAALALAQEFGFDMSNPQVQKQLGPILNDPKKVLEVIDGYIQASQMAGQATAKHVAERTAAATKAASDEKTHKMSSDATRYAADRQLESAKYRADHPAPGALKPPTTAEGAWMRDIQANENMTPDEKAALYASIINAKAQGKNSSGETVALITDPNTGKLTLGTQKVTPPVVAPVTNAPAKAAKTMSAEDTAALEWANKYPNDARSRKIKDRLGVK